MKRWWTLVLLVACKGKVTPGNAEAGDLDGWWQSESGEVRAFASAEDAPLWMPTDPQASTGAQMGRFLQQDEPTGLGVHQQRRGRGRLRRVHRGPGQRQQRQRGDRRDRPRRGARAGRCRPLHLDRPLPAGHRDRHRGVPADALWWKRRWRQPGHRLRGRRPLPGRLRRRRRLDLPAHLGDPRPRLRARSVRRALPAAVRHGVPRRPDPCRADPPGTSTAPGSRSETVRSTATTGPSPRSTRARATGSTSASSPTAARRSSPGTAAMSSESTSEAAGSGSASSTPPAPPFPSPPVRPPGRTGGGRSSPAAPSTSSRPAASRPSSPLPAAPSTGTAASPGRATRSTPSGPTPASARTPTGSAEP